MRWVIELSGVPSVSLTPVYFHVVVYGPQLRVAENGVIGNYKSDTPYVIEKVYFDYITVFTVNRPRPL